MAGQKIANAPLGSFSVKTIYDNLSNAIQEVSTASVLTVRVDEQTTYNYYGWALPAVQDATAGWRIARWTNANPNALLWADGNTSFDNSWTLRDSLIYL